MKMPISRNVAIEIISALIILLFVYTALSKFTNFTSFKLSLSQSPLLQGKINLIAWAVPTTELIISLLIIIPRTRSLGFFLATGLMLLFTLYVAYLVIFIPHVPCACGGIMKILTWPQHLIINSMYTILSAIGWRLELKQKKESRNGTIKSNVIAVG